MSPGAMDLRVLSPKAGSTLDRRCRAKRPNRYAHLFTDDLETVAEHLVEDRAADGGSSARSASAGTVIEFPS